MAAVLACGTDAALSHQSAAALVADPPALALGRPRHGAERARPARHPRPPLPPRRRHHPLRHPVTTPARTLVDLADVLNPKALTRALNEAQVLRLTTPEELTTLLTRYPGRRTARLTPESGSRPAHSLKTTSPASSSATTSPSPSATNRSPATRSTPSTANTSSSSNSTAADSTPQPEPSSKTATATPTSSTRGSPRSASPTTASNTTPPKRHSASETSCAATALIEESCAGLEGRLAVLDALGPGL
jgi:hypothetical protein